MFRMDVLLNVHDHIFHVTAAAKMHLQTSAARCARGTCPQARDGTSADDLVLVVITFNGNGQHDKGQNISYRRARGGYTEGF